MKKFNSIIEKVNLKDWPAITITWMFALALRLVGYQFLSGYEPLLASNTLQGGPKVETAFERMIA